MAQEMVPYNTAIAAEPLRSIPVLDRHFLAECLVKSALCPPNPTVDVSKSCDICGKTFSSYRALGGHKSIHNNNKRTHDDPLKKKSSKCPRSSETTESASSSLGEEQVASSSKGPYECDICGKTFSVYQALGGHKSNHFYNKNFVRTHHPTNIVNNDNKRTHDEPLKKKSRKRSRCLPLFPVPTISSESASFSLDEDQVASSSKGPYECDICGKTFSVYQALGGHKSSHSYKNTRTDQPTNIVNSHKRSTYLQLFPESPCRSTSTLQEAESASSCPEEPVEIDLELRLFPESPAQTVSTSYNTHSASSCAKGPGEIDLELRVGTMIK